MFLIFDLFFIADILNIVKYYSPNDALGYYFGYFYERETEKEREEDIAIRTEEDNLLSVRYNP